MANQIVTNYNPGTHPGSGRKRKEVEVRMLLMRWIKKWSDGTKATKQQLVSVLANAPESILHTELVRTFIENFYGEQKRYLIGYGFIPFLIYLIATIGYLTSTREKL